MGSRFNTASIRWATVLLGAVCLSADGRAEQGPAKIAVRDSVRIIVVGTEFAAGPFVIETDGAIDYPFLGRVPAAGLTARELGASIGERLVTSEILVGRPQVTVELL